jgi:DNA-binding response OmpR family regulator
MDKQSTVLVIDDELNLRRTLAMILQRAGYRVTSTGDGREALEALRAGSFDLAFLDLKLPDTNGLDLLHEIRQIQPDIPVLILTAHATLESAMEAVRQGARDYMLKPIDPHYILARAGEILAEQHEPQRRNAIISQVQELLSELRRGDGAEIPSPNVIPVIPAVDPARFLTRGTISLDLHTRHCTLENRFVPLPPSTFDYLVTLMRHSPDAVTFETLVKESQGYTPTRIEAREIVRWQIHEIRKAIEPKPRYPRYIITVRDFGYRLVG